MYNDASHLFRITPKNENFPWQREGVAAMLHVF